MCTTEMQHGWSCALQKFNMDGHVRDPPAECGRMSTKRIDTGVRSIHAGRADAHVDVDNHSHSVLVSRVESRPRDLRTGAVVVP